MYFDGMINGEENLELEDDIAENLKDEKNKINCSILSEAEAPFVV